MAGEAGAAVRREGDEDGAVPVRPQLTVVDGGARRRARSAVPRLSKRERLVLVELARGLQTDEIADAWHVSPHTVRTHVKNGMRKLGAKTRAEAVAVACLEGVIKAVR